MRRHTSPSRVAASLVAMAAAGLLVILGPAGAAAAAEQVVVTGEIDGLYPGLSGTMQASLTNQFSQPVRVTLLDTSALDAKADCPASLLTVSRSASEFEVAAGATVTTPVTVRMDLAAPDACQGATWPLHFSASLISVEGSELASTGVPAGSTLAAGLALAALGGFTVRAARRSRR